MGWARDTAAAAVEAFDALYGDGVVVAGLAIDETGMAVSHGASCPADARSSGSGRRTTGAVANVRVLPGQP